MGTSKYNHISDFMYFIPLMRLPQEKVVTDLSRYVGRSIFSIFAVAIIVSLRYFTQLLACKLEFYGSLFLKDIHFPQCLQQDVPDRLVFLLQEGLSMK